MEGMQIGTLDLPTSANSANSFNRIAGTSNQRLNTSYNPQAGANNNDSTSADSRQQNQFHQQASHYGDSVASTSSGSRHSFSSAQQPVYAYNSSSNSFGAQQSGQQSYDGHTGGSANASSTSDTALSLNYRKQSQSNSFFDSLSFKADQQHIAASQNVFASSQPPLSASCSNQPPLASPSSFKHPSNISLNTTEDQQNTFKVPENRPSTMSSSYPGESYLTGNNGKGRVVSDSFGTQAASAGPPSPSRMDMLPHQPTHYLHSSGNSASLASPNQKHAHLKSNFDAASMDVDNGHIGSGKAKAQETYEPISINSKQATTKGSSTTSEFTKRKNWSQRIVEELQDVLHVLSPSGSFLFASPSVVDLTGYTPEELLGRSVTEFMERDDIDHFIKDFTASIQTERPLTTYYRFKRKDEKPVLFEVTGQPYYTSNQAASTSTKKNKNHSGDAIMSDVKSGRNKTSGSRSEEKVCKCFFAMARPYPSKSTAMLDSFLELKIENEKLRQKLSEIYIEIEGNDPNAASGSAANERNRRMTIDTSSTALADGAAERQISGIPNRSATQTSFPHQQSQRSAQADNNTAFDTSYFGHSGQNANNPYYNPAVSGQQQSHQQQNANGLDNHGQLARGIAIDGRDVLVSSSGLIPSTSNTYGALGIGISSATARNSANASSQPAGNQNTAGASGGTAGDGAEQEDKKKKPKKPRTDEGEFVCRDCGTVDSPEWRRGPLGPKTLCNACGLRWAKKNKQATRHSISEFPVPQQ